MNRTLPSLHGGSHEITFTVPLFKFSFLHFFYFSQLLNIPLRKPKKIWVRGKNFGVIIINMDNIIFWGKLIKFSEIVLYHHFSKQHCIDIYMVTTLCCMEGWGY